MGHNFVPGLRTLKPKNLKTLKTFKKSKNLTTFLLKNLGFYQPFATAYQFIIAFDQALTTALSLCYFALACYSESTLRVSSITCRCKV